MVKKTYLKYLTVSVVVAIFSLSALTVLAQGMSAPTDKQIAADQAKEEAAARAEFEKEVGAPPEAFASHAPAVSPVYEEPQAVPDSVKQYVSDADIIPIYCAMSRWKSGPFFSAMDSLQANLVPALAKAKSDLGIDVAIPDISALKTDGEKKLQAICAASTLSDAERLSKEFYSWGVGLKDQNFGSFENELRQKMQAKGDELRQKIQTEIQPLVDSEKDSTQKEIEADVNAYVATFKFTHQPSAAEIESIRAQVDSYVKSKVDAKKAEIQNKIKAKVDEIKTRESGKFLEIGKLFEGLDAKINDGIAANTKKYDQYKQQAFELRKAVVFKILDKNIADGLKQLETSSKDIDQAKKEDPSVKSVAEIKAALQQDREALSVKLDTALGSGDENAFQQAINDFRVKWENFRQEMEKAAGQSVVTACSKAGEQFSSAKSQIDANMGRLTGLQSKCANSTSEDCLKINTFSDRFNTLTSKLTDLKSEMSIAENMCKKPDTVDRSSLIAMFKKIQSDGEDVKVYGEALDAEKSKVIADSAEKVCAQIMPQLDAARRELQLNDLVVLKNNLSSCKGKTDERCTMINGLSGAFNNLDSKIKDFAVNADKAAAFCAGAKSESDFLQISGVLNTLKSQAEDIKSAANDLKAEQADKASKKAVCKAILPSLTQSKAQASAGLNDIKSVQGSCPSVNPGCARVVETAKALQQRIEKMIKVIDDTTGKCSSAPSTPPTDDFVTGLENMRNDAQTLLADIDRFKLEAGKLKASGSGKIWVEAESAATFNRRVGVSDPMAREVNPSWRPSYYGDGSWYMGRGGDYLTYQIEAQSAGNYNFWIRDLASDIRSQWGVRVVEVFIDGRSIGRFAENEAGRSAHYPPGTFYWHKVASVNLMQGKHELKVVKAESTSGAAVLDAFYFTTGNDTLPEK